MDYIHSLDLTPTAYILDAYKKRQTDWPTYERQFLDLLQARKIESLLTPALLDNACLLCSEEKPHHCHSRFVAEYLQQHWPDVEINRIP